MTRPYVIITGAFCETGGQDVANHELARHIVRTGRRVHLVAYEVSPEFAAHPLVTVHHVPKPLDSDLLGAPLLGAAGLAVAARLARERAHVIVNGGNCPAPGCINWVHYVHASYRAATASGLAYAAKQRINRSIDVRTERLALRRARLVIANSNATRRDIIQRIGVAPDRVRTVYLGVDPTRFRPPSAADRATAREDLGWTDERPRVLFVGALGDRRKGFDTLFRTWTILCRSSGWDAVLVVVGAGAELARWEARAADGGLRERITFLGYRKDVPRILMASDALVSPVRYEPYGLNVHEALCSGLPAFVSRAAGVAERYPDSLNDLLLDDPEDDAALASALRRWRQDPSRVARQTLSLSESLRAWTWREMTDAMIRLAEDDSEDFTIARA